MTDDGMPNTDSETASLPTNPKFLAIIERSRKSLRREGGLSPAEMWRRFGLKSWDEGSGNEQERAMKEVKGSSKKGIFQLRLREVNVPEEVLLADLRRVASDFGDGTANHRLYRQYGQYAWSTLARRFGSWNAAMQRAGFSSNKGAKLNDTELFENLERVWVALGRQPARRDMHPPISAYCDRPYSRRFGSWNKALRAFISYINTDDPRREIVFAENDSIALNRGGRDVNLRMRFRIMQRDNFKCRLCGKSPSTDPNVILHVDHVVAWSLGGSTDVGNLQTLCSECNLGKSNLNSSH